VITLVSECPTLPVIGRVGILNLIPLTEQAQESIRFIDPKTRTLANSARMRHPQLKITRGLAFAHPNNLLALPKCGAPGKRTHAVTSKRNPLGVRFAL
jgi:hypothetical protein